MHLQDTHPVGQARVLIIDHDPRRTLLLARRLADEGYLVEVAHDAAAGLARARLRCPAVIILDLHLPVLDGYGFLELLRAVPACAEARVILLVGSHELAEVQRRIRRKGVAALVSKPIDPDAVLAIIRGILRVLARHDRDGHGRGSGGTRRG